MTPEELQVKMTELETRLDLLNEQIANSEKRQNEYEARIDPLWQTIINTENRAKPLPSSVEALDQEITSLTGRVASFSKSFEDAEAKLDSIESHYKDYFERPDDQSAQSKFDQVSQNFESIKKTVDAFELSRDEINKTVVFMNGDGDKQPGFRQNITSFLEKSQKDYKQLYDDQDESFKLKFDQINDLVSGATSMGLAKAYNERRRSYATPVVIWSVLFMLTLCGMIWFAIDHYKEVDNFVKAVNYILARLPFFAVTIWLGTFIAKRLSQNMRLMQEYAFKEALAKSYEGYKREIELLPDEKAKVELIKQQLQTMVKMFGYNPSKTLSSSSHEENPGFFERLFFGFRANEKKSQKKDEVTP